MIPNCENFHDGSMMMMMECDDRCLLGYPVVYLVSEGDIDAAASALSADDRVLAELHVPALVRAERQGLYIMHQHDLFVLFMQEVCK